jgi:hypothetical protein
MERSLATLINWRTDAPALAANSSTGALCAISPAVKRFAARSAPEARCFFPYPAVSSIETGMASSPFKPRAWACALEELKKRRPELDLSAFEHLPSSIRRGFDVGLGQEKVADTFVCGTRKLASAECKAMDLHFEEEESLGRVSTRMTRLEMEAFIGGPFHASRANCIEKTSGGFRSYADFSGPYNELARSRNSFITPDDFPTFWPSFQFMKSFFFNAHQTRGSQVAGVDAKGFFRQFPISVRDRQHLVVQVGKDAFRANLRMDLGISSAPGVAGNLADFVALLLETFFDVQVLKWVDDFTISKLLSNPVGLPDLYRFFAFLGLEMSLGKEQPFGTAVEFFGFLWDIQKGSISLPLKKRAKYIERIASFQLLDKVDRRCVERLVGCLMHVSLICLTGAANCRQLIRFMNCWHGQDVFRLYAGALSQLHAFV